MCFEYSYAYVNEETIIHDPFSKKEKLSLIAGCMRFFYAKRDNLSIHCNFYRTNTSETHTIILDGDDVVAKRTANIQYEYQTGKYV